MLALGCQGRSPWQSTAEYKPVFVEAGKRDAEAAFAARDARLLGVKGLTYETPGVFLPFPEAQARYGVRVLEGTTDAYESPADMRKGHELRSYVITYNTVMRGLADSAGARSAAAVERK